MKACLGAGVERGVAREAGLACAEVALRGAASLGFLCDHLSELEDQRGACDWRFFESAWHCARISRLGHAVSMVDLALVAEPGAFCERMECPPALLTGLALARWRSHGEPFEISADGKDWIAASEAMSWLVESERGGSLALRRIAGRHESEPEPWRALSVGDQHWQMLEPWIARTLVKPTAANRTDAGAGDTDND
ncbi:MAG: hypothetical protein OXR62_00085 [Ahrensia sp.]|nr:hypothetical protein [Ahrensia sp.]